MVFELDSSKSLEQIDEGLRQAAGRHNFGVVAVHNLREMMKNKGVEYGADCLVYEICSPRYAKKALEANAAISSALPCRISVYGARGGYKLSTIRPTELMKPLETPALGEVAAEVERDVVAMMRESA